MKRKLLYFLMMLLAGANLNAQPPGNALNFDGVNDFVSMGNDESIRVSTGVMTLEAWIYPTNLGTTNWGQTILSKTHVIGGVVYGYILRHGTGTAQFLIGTNNNWKHVESPAGSIAVNRWTHVAAVSDGSEMRLYINGLVVASFDISGDTYNSPDEGNATIGTETFYSDRRYTGQIDEVKIWNVARTENEIRAGMKQPLVGNETGLVAYYDFDETEGTTLPDRSSNNNTGTLNNMDNTAWVASQAMNYAPMAQPATAVTETGFTANWRQVFCADSYYLDVSTQRDFFTFIDGYNGFEIVGGATISHEITGIASGTYYYRVRSFNDVTGSSSENSITVNASNLVWNGDFSLGNIGFETSYTHRTDNLHDAGTYAVTTNANLLHNAFPSALDHTNDPPHRLYFAANGGVVGDVNEIVWRTPEDSPIVVTGNLDYRFEAYIMNFTWSPPILRFQLGDGTTWVDLGDSPALVGSGEWVFTFADGRFSQSGNYFIRLINMNTDESGNDFGIDDIYFGLRSSAPSIGDEPGVATPTVFETGNLNSAPTVTTQAVTNITTTTATGNGNINDLGTPNPTAHGICWATTPDPTTADSFEDNGAATVTGTFTAAITGLSPGTTYFVRAFATNSVGTAYGQQVSFQTSFPPLQAGTASGTQTICYDQMPASLTATAPTGCAGSYSYQWQVQVDASWVDITGANALIYQPGTLTQTTSYRLAQTDANCTPSEVYTNEITVTVRPEFNPGEIAATGETICYGGTPTQLIGSITDASGGFGVISYTWKSSTDGFANSTLIEGATAATYKPPAGLTATTAYRRYATNADCNTTPVESVGTWTVTVHPEFTAGKIETDGEIICYGGTPSQVIGSETDASGGVGVISYTWRSSLNNFASAIAGATGPTYTPAGTFTQTTAFRRYANDAGCNTTPQPSAGTWTVTVSLELAVTNPLGKGVVACDFVDSDALKVDFDNWIVDATVSVTASVVGAASPTISDNRDKFDKEDIFCGGSFKVVWTVDDECGTVSASATYGVDAPGALAFDDPQGLVTNTCIFDNETSDTVQAQYDLNTAIAAWVTEQTGIVSNSLSGGCSPIVINDFNSSEPAFQITLCQGGTITVTWTITDLCETASRTAAYTLNKPVALTIGTVSSVTHDACDPEINNQKELEEAFDNWFAEQTQAITMQNGCSPEVTNNWEGQKIYPDFFTEEIEIVTVTWTITDLCETKTVTATFTFKPGKILTVSNIGTNGEDIRYYCTIQAAIDGALEGDVIIITKGTYEENVDTKGKQLTLRFVPVIIPPSKRAGDGRAIRIDGSMKLNPGDKLEIEIFSQHDFDALEVTDELDLNNATLVVSSYLPEPGHRFKIITAGSLAGEFANKNIVTTTDDKSFVIQYVESEAKNTDAVILTNIKRIFRMIIKTEEKK